MREAGVDLASAAVWLTAELAGTAFLRVTMGCGEACPWVPGLRRENWPLPDPKGRPRDEVQEFATRSAPAWRS
jgi:arsenate reductase (thioredoxin)